MKVMIIQPPYAHSVAEAESVVRFLTTELQQCDDSVDLVVLPEYSNAPGPYDSDAFPRAVRRYTGPLLDSVADTARRCQALVAVNLALPHGDSYRNTTILYDRSGQPVAHYLKQHLPVSELAYVDSSYTEDYRAPCVAEIEGLRIGFLTCYDFYFSEYISHLAAKNLDIIIGPSYQRSERRDILEMLGKFCAFTCNAYLVRASVSMGADHPLGGCSMVVSPDGSILAQFGQKTGSFTCAIDPQKKYYRSNGHGNPDIRNDLYISNGRTPWAYRPCGSAMSPKDDHVPYPRICARGGLVSVAPPNSLLALTSAVALDAREVEIELRFTADSTPIDCLEAILAKLSCHTIMNLHVIFSEDMEEQQDTSIREIIRLIDAYDCRRHVTISGNRAVLLAAAWCAPDITRCLLPETMQPDIVEQAIALGCRKIRADSQCFTSERIAKAHANGIRCYATNLNDPADLQAILARGLDAVCTDRFTELQKQLNTILNKGSERS